MWFDGEVIKARIKNNAAVIMAGYAANANMSHNTGIDLSVSAAFKIEEMVERMAIEKDIEKQKKDKEFVRTGKA